MPATFARSLARPSGFAFFLALASSSAMVAGAFFEPQPGRAIRATQASNTMSEQESRRRMGNSSGTIGRRSGISGGRSGIRT